MQPHLVLELASTVAELVGLAMLAWWACTGPVFFLYWLLVERRRAR